MIWCFVECVAADEEKLKGKIDNWTIEATLNPFRIADMAVGYTQPTKFEPSAGYIHP